MNFIVVKMVRSEVVPPLTYWPAQTHGGLYPSFPSRGRKDTSPRKKTSGKRLKK